MSRPDDQHPPRGGEVDAAGFPTLAQDPKMVMFLTCGAWNGGAETLYAGEPIATEFMGRIMGAMRPPQCTRGTFAEVAKGRKGAKGLRGAWPRPPPEEFICPDDVHVKRMPRMRRGLRRGEHRGRRSDLGLLCAHAVLPSARGGPHRLRDWIRSEHC